MIKLKIIIPTDVFEAIQEQAQKVPALVNGGLDRRTLSIRRRLLSELQAEPGPPKYPIRWKSERQRRAFFATDGFGGGIPTRRTGNIGRNWKVDVSFTADGGAISATNDTPYARYVQGDDAQPFHLDTGWPQAAPLFVQYSDILEDDLIDFWFTVVDPFAGVKG